VEAEAVGGFGGEGPERQQKAGPAGGKEGEKTTLIIFPERLLAEHATAEAEGSVRMKLLELPWLCHTSAALN